MTQPLFLFGAGFNADAYREAGPIYGTSLYVGRHRIEAGYPFGAETARLCFGLPTVPSGKSAEDLFAEALQRNNPAPLEKLADRLSHADYHLAHGLASATTSNCYRKFFEKFADADFLTFNYDSLPETFLFRMEKWYPHDGYGVQVAVRLAFGQANFSSQKSSSNVVHLHGSLSICTSESEIEGNPSDGIAWLRERERPLYTFDPDSISGNFQGRYELPVRSRPVQDRVIAPIPNKAEELTRPFVEESYERARALVSAAENLVVIGYSFNQYDEASYEPILKALTETQGKLVLVSPEAPRLKARLGREHPSLEIEPIEKSFAGWVAASFPGVAERSMEPWASGSRAKPST